MKKLLTLLLSAIMLAFSVFAVGCTPNDGNTEDFNIYTPDGAPALALSKLMVENETLGVNAKYTVVNQSLKPSPLAACIANKTADIAVLPITAATKLCGDGSNYKMIASITNGNLFIIGKGTGTTLADLVGKKVAVVNLADFPGIAFRALLKKNDIDSVQINAEDTADANKVNLVAIAGTAAKTSLDTYDYVVAPQPAATNAIKNVTGAQIRMDIQELWGGNMVQAVVVVKNTHASNTALINRFLTALAKTTNEWLTTNKVEAVNAINAHYGESTSTLNANALNATSIAGSNIKVVTAINAGFNNGDNALVVTLSELKTRVNNMITAFTALNDSPNPIGTVTDAFYLA